jgi:hypothetical protein
MRKRISLLIAALMLALTMSFGAVAAFAAPITCPGPQQPERVGGQWVCVNPADNPSGAAETKNPND